MEKKLYDLSIDEELESLIPPLQEVELKMLTESLLENGCEMPLVVWNDIIVDGHNRYRICRENGIPFAIEKKDFESREAAKIWLIKNQLGRRNLPDFVKCELVIPMRELLKEQAEMQRRKRISDSRRSSGENETVENFPPSQPKTREILAGMAGVSDRTLDKAKKIIESADEETKDKLRKGEVSIHKVYTELKAAEKTSSPDNSAPTARKLNSIPSAEESAEPKQELEAVQEPVPEPESTLGPTPTPKQDKPIVPKSYKDLFSRPVFSRDQPLCVVKEPIPFEPVVSAATMAAFEAEKRERERKANMEEASADAERSTHASAMLEAKAESKEQESEKPKYTSLLEKPIFENLDQLPRLSRPIAFCPGDPVKMAELNGINMDATSITDPPTKETDDQINPMVDDLRDLINDFLEDLAEILDGFSESDKVMEMFRDSGTRAISLVKEYAKKTEEQK